MPGKRGRPWKEAEVRKYVGETRGITIPVNIVFEGSQKILPSKQVERLLRKARTISVSECECRTKVRACDNPRDVCLQLNEAAEELINKGDARKIDLTEALAVLKRSGDAGLVHAAYIDRGKPDDDPKYICSCCSCCCYAITAMRKFGFNDSIVASDRRSGQDEAACTDCGLCADRCHFEARKIVEGHLVFDPSRCFGCGSCVAVCVPGAISMVKRTHKTRRSARVS